MLCKGVRELIRAFVLYIMYNFFSPSLANEFLNCF